MYALKTNKIRVHYIFMTPPPNPAKLADFVCTLEYSNLQQINNDVTFQKTEQALNNCMDHELKKVNTKIYSFLKRNKLDVFYHENFFSTSQLKDYVTCNK